MAQALIEKLTGVRDLKKILETTVQELGEQFGAEACQIMLGNPLDANVTSICEYRASKSDLTDLPSLKLPIVLQGNATGMVSLAWNQPVEKEQVNAIRTILTELAEIIRLAQINDIVQRNTFRDTFLVEISNVMAYSLGIGDALFMVVNILGKVLHASRCIFVCTDDTQKGWRCYEYWQQGEVASCQDYRWPTTDSPIVAQTLLATQPVIVYEGQENSYLTPAQEELQLIDARSILGLALRSDTTTHGCVILQQCDWRRAWTRQEIDMVQNVADKVAEALSKLPQEKLVREPIMQLHQRIVTAGEAPPDKESIQAVRRALKEALGQKSIPTAQKTSMPPPAQTQMPAEKQPVAPPPPTPEPAQAFEPPQAVPEQAPSAPQFDFSQPEAAPEPGSVQAKGKSLGSILGGNKSASMPSLDFGVTLEGEAAPGKPADTTPSYDQFWETPGASPTAPEMPPPPPAPEPVVQETPVAGVEPVAEETPPVLAEPEFAPEAPAADAGWGDLDKIPTPGSGGAAASESHWSELDSIPTPAAGPASHGLAASMFGKPKGPTAQAQSSSLLASLHKDKSMFEQPANHVEFVEGPPVEIDEKKAEAKLKELMSQSDPTSDYIFATQNVDMRILGRIDGWVTEIEAKDKYKSGHAKAVAEYSQAIAKQIGMGEKEIAEIRLAALLHDVGKLGLPKEVLQKSEDELTDEELVWIMKHPLDGSELIESIAELAHLAPVVLAHHEEYNGNGYPAGLAGEDIPLAARIIHLADSYHQMTTDLTYRKAMSAQDAQVELTKGAGSQWEARLVEALILCLMQKVV